MDSYGNVVQGGSADNDNGAPTPPLRVPLGDAINGSTRSIHSKLNRMVLLRLPLAVPPCTDNPSLYITGLLHLAPIYITFENLWRSLLPTDNDLALPPAGIGHESSFFMGHELPPFPTTDNDKMSRIRDTASSSSPALPSHISTVLSDVHIPELQRSDRLRADIAVLTGWPAEIVEEQLRDAANTSHLAAFIRHIEDAVARHPHVLLAYAWVLYMALFAGGRFIRASLESAGDNFWKRRPDPVLPSMMPCAASPHDRRHSSIDKPVSPPLSPPLPSECATHAERNRAAASPGRGYPLSFFHFAPLISASSSPSHPTLRRDGEDLKAVFKSRLAAADEQLSDRERGHVVREAEHVFENIILLAQQLDDACGGGEDKEFDGLEDEDFSRNSPLVRLMKARAGRMRDSIALSKEKAERVASQAGRCASGEASSSRTDADEKGKDRREVSIGSTTSNSSGDSSSVSTISDFLGHVHDPDAEEPEQASDDYAHASGTRAIRKQRSVVRFGARHETIPELCCAKMHKDADDEGDAYEDAQESAPAPPPTPPTASRHTGFNGAADEVLRGSCPATSNGKGVVKRKGKGSSASLVRKMPHFQLPKMPTVSQVFLIVVSIGLLLGYVYVRGSRDVL